MEFLAVEYNFFSSAKLVQVSQNSTFANKVGCLFMIIWCIYLFLTTNFWLRISYFYTGANYNKRYNINSAFR